MDFYSVIRGLRNHQSPVLACNVRPGLAAHEKTVCLGFLSEEHLLALLILLNRPVIVNLTECKDCTNDFIVGVIRERLRNIKENTSTKLGEMIEVVENRSDLDYQEVSYDRRGFFNALKNLTVQGAAGFLEKVDREQTVQSYSTKALPLRRELLNRSFSFSPEGIRKEILRSYYFDVTVDGICGHCSACVGVCPTGALKIGQNGSDRALFFNTALCSGCGLCKRFCRTHSISLQKGFSGVRPFEFDIAKKAPSCTSDSEAGRGFQIGGGKALGESICLG